MHLTLDQVIIRSGHPFPLDNIFAAVKSFHTNIANIQGWGARPYAGLSLLKV